MRYATLKRNDVANGPGINVSLYLQGCPHKCYNCFNKDTWDFNGGKEFTYDVISEIIEALTANGIKRNLCILGGEPLCPENQFLTLLVIRTVKEKLPDTKVYIWTGYLYDNLPKTQYLEQILSHTHCIVDGPYIESERDITLPMRGSRNQHIIYLDNQENK